jgi:thymidylate kinase
VGQHSPAQGGHHSIAKPVILSHNRWHERDARIAKRAQESYIGMPTTAMVIELLGLPGAGKSTLSRLIADRLAATDLVVEEATFSRDHGTGRLRRVAEKFIFVLAYLCAEPCRAAHVLGRVTRTRQATLFDWATSVVNFFYIASLYRQAVGGPGVLLLDQGIAQAVWSIGFAAQQRCWDQTVGTGRFLSPLPDLVVVVRASPEVILARLGQREKRASRLEEARFNPADTLDRCSDRLSAVIALLRHQNVELIEVFNEGKNQLETEVEQIVALTLRRRANFSF